MFSDSAHPSPKIVLAPLRGLIFIDTTNKFSIKINSNIARNIICFIMKLSMPNKNFQSILFTYPFQSLAIVRICFEAEI